MLPTAIKRKLTLTIMCALLMVMSLLLTTHPHTAFAQTSSPAVSITLERVFTADTNGSEKTSFAPGDAIRYVAVIDNSSGQPTKVTLGVISGGPSGPNAKVIYKASSNITLPSGRSTWYGQSTIPQDAMDGEYVVAADVKASGINHTANGTFTVTSGG